MNPTHQPKGRPSGITRIARCLLAPLLAMCIANCGKRIEPPPDDIVDRVTHAALQLESQEKRVVAVDRQHSIEQSDDKSLNQFDFTRMTALAVGLAWRDASADQKRQLERQFRKLLERTWYAGWSRVGDRAREYQPVRLSPEGTQAILRCLLTADGASTVTIDYRLSKLPGGWKTLDVRVDGVSFVTTHRDSFSEEVRRAGLDGLVRLLIEKNAQFEASD